MATKGLLERVTAWIVLVLAVGFGASSMVAFAVFLYAGPPDVIDLDLGFTGTLATNTGLSLLFFLQHSGMVRARFKLWLLRFVPEHYSAATYAIASGIVLLLVVLLWQESEQLIATAAGAICWTARAVFALAVAGIAWGVLALGGFDSLGLKPIRNRFRSQAARPSVLTIRGPYRWVRHPLYSFVLVMMWSYPHLTVDRLLFNVLWTVWIVVGAVLEERDLVAEFGDRYQRYQQEVPMLVPNRVAGWS